MNAERLLAHYEKIADAPNAIGRLRRFILDLAVRGKLVPQDPKDEPASELLKRIAKEKARLVNAGEIKTFPAPLNVTGEDQPFDLPRDWRWVRLGDVLTKLTDGTHHSPPNGDSGDFKYISAKNIKDEGVSLANVSYVEKTVHEEIYSRCNPEKGDILYIKDGATTGVVTVNDLDEPFSMLSSVALLKLPSCIFNRLFVVFLRSPFFYEQMRGFMKGAAIPRVTLKRMAPALIPLPPLAEQHRIVAKVDELMALCDRLEAARAEREGARDRLAASSLARLNAPDPETFQADASFVLKALPALTTRPDQIKRLRQTILNLAVRGKLVPQDPKDEPSSELLESISVKRRKLVTEGIVRPEKQLAVRSSTCLFEAPHGWAWTNANQLWDFENGDRSKNYPSKDQLVPEGIPFINAGHLEGGLVSMNDMNFVTSAKFKQLGGGKLRFGDQLYCLRGSLGKHAVYLHERDAAIASSLVILRPIEAQIVSYLMKYLDSDIASMMLRRFDNGTAQPNLSAANLRLYEIPLPPLAEQHRIVAKVDELMALCDQLEASLTDAAATSHRLLEALLVEALAPADAREREVAA